MQKRYLNRVPLELGAMKGLGQNMAASPLFGLLSAEAAEKLAHYVLARQKEDGGFGLTPRLPATVEDTYHAVRILEMLGRDENLTRTRDYLERLEWSISRRAKIIYAILYLRRKFACPPVAPDTFFTAPNPCILEEVYYWQKIARLCANGGDSLRSVLELDLPSLALPTNFTIKEVHYYLALKACCLTPSEAARWADWVQACQTPDGGFGFKPGTTAFMDNVLPALEILRQLGQRPRHTERLLDFIRACQTLAGGFARTSGGVAFLESSFQAVKALCLLSRSK